MRIKPNAPTCLVRKNRQIEKPKISNNVLRLKDYLKYLNNYIGNWSFFHTYNKLIGIACIKCDKKFAHLGIGIKLK